MAYLSLVQLSQPHMVFMVQQVELKQQIGMVVITANGMVLLVEGLVSKVVIVQTQLLEQGEMVYIM
jgi:hypothetical protein